MLWSVLLVRFLLVGVALVGVGLVGFLFVGVLSLVPETAQDSSVFMVDGGMDSPEGMISALADCILVVEKDSLYAGKTKSKSEETRIKCQCVYRADCTVMMLLTCPRHHLSLRIGRYRGWSYCLLVASRIVWSRACAT